MDFKIDDVSGDVSLLENGDLATVEKRDAIAQHIRARWQFFLAEWFLDTREGVPWLEQIFVAAPDLNAITELFRRTTADTPGVAWVRALRLAFDAPTRSLSVSEADIVTTDGETIGPDDFARPFVIVAPNV